MNAFEAELQNLLPRLRRYALALTRSPDAADDLTQDCAERALRKQALYVPDVSANMTPWLMTMMLNLHRNRIRAQNARPAEVPATPCDDLQAPDQLAGRLQLSDTARAIDSLPEEQRDVLLTVVLGGMSYKDAAETLSIPLGTLMSRLGRARSHLRGLQKQGAL